MAGAAERAYGVQVTYVSYLLLQAPILGVAKGILLTACITILFPAAPVRTVQEDAPQPVSSAELRMALLLGVTLLLWLTPWRFAGA